MPEGPEVQTVVNDLRELGLIGKCIKSTIVYPQVQTDPKWKNFRGFVLQNPERLKLLDNSKIIDIQRIAKFICFKLENDYNILVHLSFTGCFKIIKSEEKEPNPMDYPAITFIFDDVYLTFCTKRGLSKIWILTDKELAEKESVKSVVVDGLKDGPETIYRVLLTSRQKLIKEEIKPFLLNYKHIAGIGNIYGSEICYKAKVNPTIKVKDLNDKQIASLASAIKVVLYEALEHRGSSVEDFNSLGKDGTHQNYLKVYGKKICECGAEIKMIKQKGRSTYYCSKEQELI